MLNVGQFQILGWLRVKIWFSKPRLMILNFGKMGIRPRPHLWIKFESKSKLENLPWAKTRPLLFFSFSFWV
jgi:hypothetical protein